MNKLLATFILCLSLSLPAACAASESTQEFTKKGIMKSNSPALCRPLGQALISKPPSFGSRYKETERFIFSGDWKDIDSFSNKSTDFATWQGVPFISAVLSSKLCTNTIGVKDFENIANQLLENHRDKLSKNTTRRKSTVAHELSRTKALELLKFEGLAEIAAQNKDWDLLKSHLETLKTTTQSWAKPLNFNNQDHNADLYYLETNEEADHFSLAALETYYTGILALGTGDDNTVAETLIKFSQVNNDYSFSYYPDYIMASPDNSDQLRAAVVTHAILAMNFANHIQASDIDFALTTEQRLDHYISSIRAMILHGRNADLYTRLLSPKLLNSQKQTFEGPKMKHPDVKHLSEDLFKISHYNFRQWWPYNYGPYLWKYSSHLSVDFWQNKLGQASTEREKRGGKQNLCKAQRLHKSLGLSSQTGACP